MRNKSEDIKERTSGLKIEYSNAQTDKLLDTNKSTNGI